MIAEAAAGPGSGRLQASQGESRPVSEGLARSKIRRSMQALGTDAWVLFGPDNFTYVTGAALPFAQEQFDRWAVALVPERGQEAVVCPLEWSAAIADQGWAAPLHVYDEEGAVPPLGCIEAVAGAILAMGLSAACLGLDLTRVSRSAVDALRHRLPSVTWVGIDEALWDARMVKGSKEVDLLETAAQQSQKAFVSALNHAEATIDLISYTVAEFTERIRVHVGEFGGSATGHVVAVQGEDARLSFVPPHGSLQAGNLVRMEVTNHYHGYWSSAARTVVVGEPTPLQRKAYRDNLLLKARVVEALRPGVRCEQVFAAVDAAAAQAGIPFWREAGAGHGVGTSEREAPFLSDGDETTLAPGMVLAVGVYTYGPGGELVLSKDTYVVSKEGSRLLSWYRNWDRLYAMTGITARHG